MRNFLYRLLFTKEDGLDLSQLILLGLYVLFGFVVVNTSRGVWTISRDVLEAFIWVFGLANINAAPQWIALELIRSKSWQGFNRAETMSTDLQERQEG